MERVIIIGAGGHGRVIAEAIISIGNHIVGFLDDNISGDVMGIPVIGKTENACQYDKECTFVIGIGDNHTRRVLAEKHTLKWHTVIHPSASIARDVIIGAGSVILRGVCINSSTKIGNHCIVNTGAIIEHDNVISDYVHVSPNATLCGTVNIGEETHIGAGAVIKNNLHITRQCIIGLGAVVVEDATKSGIYIGVPARYKIDK